MAAVRCLRCGREHEDACPFARERGDTIVTPELVDVEEESTEQQPPPRPATDLEALLPPQADDEILTEVVVIDRRALGLAPREPSIVLLDEAIDEAPQEARVVRGRKMSLENPPPTPRCPSCHIVFQGTIPARCPECKTRTRERAASTKRCVACGKPVPAAATECPRCRANQV